MHGVGRVLWADLDGDLLARAVENTLDNALRHTPRFGQIVLEARADGACLRISVGNSGEPIPN